MAKSTAKISEIVGAATASREKAREEALGMIRALRKKLDETEGILKRDGAPAFMEGDAGIEEAMTLSYRLSRFNAADAIARGVAPLKALLEEDLAAQAETKKARKPAAAPEGEGAKEGEGDVQIPDLEGDAPPKAKGKK